MLDNEVKESQKTVVAFIAGLLVGGLLVWAFGSDTKTADAPEKDTDAEVTLEETVSNTENSDEPTAESEAVPELPVGNASVQISDQSAGSMAKLESATFPTDEGWIAVRQYSNDKLGSILGAILYSKSAGIIPSQIPLVVPMTAGREYAIVFFSQDSNRAFNLDGDVQLNTDLITFTAQ